MKNQLIFSLIFAFTVFASLWLFAGVASTPPAGMVFIPAGPFVRGTSAQQTAELAARYHVDPSLFLDTHRTQEKANLAAFYIDRYEVTNREYKRFLEATGHPAPEPYVKFSLIWTNGTYPEGQEDFPVVGTALEDAEAYARWVGKRLPTEDEWEKAARGTDGRFYPWGNQWSPHACAGDTAKREGDSFGPAPVGSFPRDVSPYGVFDMGGNVAEWTATVGGVEKHWPNFEIIKGGSFAFSEPYSFLAAGRLAVPVINGSVGYIGFRCAMDAPADAKRTACSLPRRVTAVRRGRLPESRTPGPNDVVRIYPDARGHVEFEVPSLPGNRFGLQLLESIRGIPGIQQSDVSVTTAPDHSSADCRWQEPTTVKARLEISVHLQGHPDSTDLVYHFKNVGSESRKADVSSCFQSMYAPSFRDHEGARTLILTEHGFQPVTALPRKPLNRAYLRLHFPLSASSIAKAPFLAIVSRDHNWVVSEVTEGTASLFSNNEYSCQHAIAPFELQPGQSTTIRQKIYFLYADLSELLARWKADFRK